MSTLIAEDLLLLLLDDDLGTLAAASYTQPILGGGLLIELALGEAVEVGAKQISQGAWAAKAVSDAIAASVAATSAAVTAALSAAVISS